LRGEPKRLGQQGLGAHQRLRVWLVPQVLEPLRQSIGSVIEPGDQVMLPFG
jgi:hypothetical protein